MRIVQPACRTHRAVKTVPVGLSGAISVNPPRTRSSFHRRRRSETTSPTADQPLRRFKRKWDEAVERKESRRYCLASGRGPQPGRKRTLCVIRLIGSQPRSDSTGVVIRHDRQPHPAGRGVVGAEADAVTREATAGCNDPEHLAWGQKRSGVHDP